MKHIKEISIYDLPDTRMEPDGYDMKDVPDSTAKNMEVFMDKINEIVEIVNQLLPPE